MKLKEEANSMIPSIFDHMARNSSTIKSNYQLHAGKLHIQLPELSTFYSPEQYLSHARLVESQLDPLIVCLCGSTRFMDAFQQANLRETLAMRIVLSVGCDTKSDALLDLSKEVKVQLDRLHLRKIDLADEVLILNIGKYVGESTSREICYAEEHGKYVRWLEPMGFDVFRAADQGRCACCDAEARWLRLDAGQSVPTAALCDRHAWVEVPNGPQRNACEQSDLKYERNEHMLLKPDQLLSLLRMANEKNENGVNPFWKMMKEGAKTRGIKEEDMSLLHCLTCFFFPGYDAIAMERAYDKMGFESWQAVIAYTDLKTYCRIYDAYNAASSKDVFLDNHEDGKYYYTSRTSSFPDD